MRALPARLCCLLALCSLVVLSGGCAAVMTGLTHKDLDVQTISSDTIFMDIEDRQGNKVFVDVRNTSDKELHVREQIIAQLTSKGYRIVSSTKAANYILQANILSVGKVEKTALEKFARSGYGVGLTGAGALTGALIGTATHSWTGVGTGALVGGLVAGGAEMVAGALVKAVTYAIITDVMITEKTSYRVRTAQVDVNRVGRGSVRSSASARTANRHQYTTRIASHATKVNLKFEEALPALEDGLVRNIAGIFGHY